MIWWRWRNVMMDGEWFWIWDMWRLVVWLRGLGVEGNMRWDLNICWAYLGYRILLWGTWIWCHWNFVSFIRCVFCFRFLIWIHRDFRVLYFWFVSYWFHRNLRNYHIISWLNRWLLLQCSLWIKDLRDWGEWMGQMWQKGRRMMLDRWWGIERQVFYRIVEWGMS